MLVTAGVNLEFFGSPGGLILMNRRRMGSSAQSAAEIGQKGLKLSRALVARREPEEDCVDEGESQLRHPDLCE
jgi:hypothetical protein